MSTQPGHPLQADTLALWPWFAASIRVYGEYIHTMSWCGSERTQFITCMSMSACAWFIFCLSVALFFHVTVLQFSYCVSDLALQRLSCFCNIFSWTLQLHLSVVIMSSVCRLWHQCIVTKQLNLGLCSFYNASTNWWDVIDQQAQTWTEWFST